MTNVIVLTDRVKKSIVGCILLITVLLSVFCLKKYFANSNVISYDLSTFNISEGFQSELIGDSLVISPTEGYEGTIDFCASSSYTLIDKGNYSVGLTYESDGYNAAYFQAGDSVYEEILLPAGNQTVFMNFQLEQSVEDARLRVFYSGDGAPIRVRALVLQCDRPMVTDWIVIFALLWGVVLSGLLYAKVFIDGTLTKEHIYEISFVLLVAVLSVPFVILMNKGIYWGSDTTAHNMRIEGIKDALLGGQFPVVIAPSMCNGYGSISPVMYPSLFLYPFAVLRILGVSPVMVYKMAHIIINVFMCSTCYVCVKKITRNSVASGIALLAFAFSRFHLSMLGTRDWTYGMGIALIFLFVVIIGVYEIFFGKKEEWPYLTLGMWGIMNSHIMTTLFAAVIVGIFTVALFGKLRREDRLWSLVKATLASIPICLYRMYTFLDAYFNNDLNTSVLNLNEYQDRVYSLTRVIREPLILLSFSVAIIAFVFLIINYKKMDKAVKTLFGIVGGINAFCVFLMLDLLPWERMISMELFYEIFGYIQFPNRLLQMALPFSVILIGLMCTELFNRLNSSKTAVSRVVVRCSISVGVFAVLLMSAWSYVVETKALTSLDNVFSDKVMGDVYSFPGMDDYVPEGENGESYGGRLPYYSNDNIYIDPETYEKNGINISGEILCSEDNSYIDFPVFGYKGYECKDLDGNKYETGIGEHHRLRVYFDESTTPVFVNISYHVPRMYFVLQLLSYASLLALVTFNKDFLARTKSRVHYYETIRKLTRRTKQQEQ